MKYLPKRDERKKVIFSQTNRKLSHLFKLFFGQLIITLIAYNVAGLGANFMRCSDKMNVVGGIVNGE